MKKFALAGLLVLIAACGSGTESTSSDARNVAIPVGLFGKQAHAISAGSHHSCAITTVGTVECWGSNRWGQLGQGAGVTESKTPIAVDGLPTTTKAVRLAKGSMARHVCALFDNGDLYCWGNNSAWQIVETAGAGTTSGPVRVATNIIDVAVAAASTCTIDTNHRVQCWGAASYSQLGDGGLYPSNVSISKRLVGNRYVDTQGNAVEIAAGNRHYCVLYDDQTVDCWGDNLSRQTAQTGLAIVEVTTPTLVAGLPAITSIALGRDHSCALDVQGAMWCWGAGDRGQLGSGRQEENATPQQVRFSPGAVGALGRPLVASAIFAGGNNTCVVDDLAMVNCWGSADSRLWGGGVDASPLYATVVAGTSETAIGALGESHLCTVSKFGLPQCRGGNDQLQVGVDSNSVPVVQMTGVPTYVASNFVVPFPTFGDFISVDFGLLGGGVAGGGQAIQNPNDPAQPNNTPAPGGSDPAQAGGNTPATTAAAPPTTTAAAPPTTVASASATVAAAKVYRLKVRRTAQSRTLARWAGLKVSKGSKVSFTVARGSARKCAKSAGKLRASRVGTCKVRVKVTKKGAKTRAKTVTVTIVR